MIEIRQAEDDLPNDVLLGPLGYMGGVDRNRSWLAVENGPRSLRGAEKQLVL